MVSLLEAVSPRVLAQETGWSEERLKKESECCDRPEILSDKDEELFDRVGTPSRETWCRATRWSSL